MALTSNHPDSDSPFCFQFPSKEENTSHFIPVLSLHTRKRQRMYISPGQKKMVIRLHSNIPPRNGSFLISHSSKITSRVTQSLSAAIRGFFSCFCFYLLHRCLFGSLFVWGEMILGVSVPYLGRKSNHGHSL